MKAVSDKDFEAEVLKSATPVLVDFSATWCGPCKNQVPILEQLAGEVGDKLAVVKMDIEESPATSQKYRVLSVPTLILFHKGEVAKRWTGVTRLDPLKEAVEACK